MPAVDPDDLFGGGAEIGRDVVVKARIRFRVRPPRSLAARDVVDRVVAAYDERVGMVVAEVAEVLRQADPRRSAGPPLVVAVDPGQVSKAAKHAPFRPGSRGGNWYRDSRGNIRYGVPPTGKFTGNAGSASPMPHVDHLRPGPFMRGSGNDQELVGFLVEDGGNGFSDGELRFLGAWYGTGEEGGELLDAFLECAGLTREDLKGDVANLRFGGQGLTYEEAVFEFFAAQGALFTGEEPASESQVEGWHRVLNDEIKPLLDGVFGKYEAAKSDRALQERVKGEPERRRRRFFDAARRSDEDTRGFADRVTGDWKPERRVDAAVAGMRALGLIARPARALRRAYHHGRPHLRDAVTTDGRLLGGGPGNPLLGDTDRLATLPASQLMLLFVAAELHRRWDQHSRSFSTEEQVSSGSGELGEAAMVALAAKTARWSDASGVVSERLAEMVDLVVARLNRVNAREGTPAKHGPARKPRGPR